MQQSFGKIVWEIFSAAWLNDYEIYRKIFSLKLLYLYGFVLFCMHLYLYYGEQLNDYEIYRKIGKHSSFISHAFVFVLFYNCICIILYLYYFVFVLWRAAEWLRDISPGRKTLPMLSPSIGKSHLYGEITRQRRK